MNSKEIVSLLKTKNLTIAFAESITGGSLASDLVTNAGASEVFEIGLITYSNKMKKKFLNIKKSFINQYGVVSEKVVKMMAVNVKNLAKSDIGIATSGNAGPTVLGNTSVGDVWIAIAFKDKTFTYKLKIKEESRENIINETVKKTWEFLSKLLIIG